MREKLRRLRWWLALRLIPNGETKEIFVRLRSEHVRHWGYEQLHRLLNFIRDEHLKYFPKEEESRSDGKLDLKSFDGAMKWFYGVQLTHWITFKLEEKPESEQPFFKTNVLFKYLSPAEFVGDPCDQITLKVKE